MKCSLIMVAVAAYPCIYILHFTMISYLPVNGSMITKCLLIIEYFSKHIRKYIKKSKITVLHLGKQRFKKFYSLFSLSSSIVNVYDGWFFNDTFMIFVIVTFKIFVKQCTRLSYTLTCKIVPLQNITRRKMILYNRPI